MNKLFRFVFVFFGCLFSIDALEVTGPQENSVEGEIGTSIAEVVRSEGKAGFSGVVLAELRGEVVGAVAVGSRGDARGNPNTTDTLFEIGSVTKPLTAVTVLLLAQQGKLSLDDPIHKHLPKVPENCEGITIRHLLQHTSGIPGTNNGPFTIDADVVVPVYLKGGPQHEPGTNHEYWNQGYALLSAIIAHAAGAEYTDATRDLLFEPAGMSNACFTGDPSRARDNVAFGQSTNGPSRSALEPPYGDFYGLQYRGMGGAVCNVHDLYNLVKSIRAGELLSDETREEMLKPGPGNYAIGWKVESVGESQRRIFHSGGVRGFLASVSWYPEDESCLIVLFNSDNGGPFLAVESACRKLLESEFVKIPEQRVFSEEVAGTLVGDFAGTIPNGRKLEIAIRRNGLGLEMLIDWGGPKSAGVLERGDDNEVWFVDGSSEQLKLTLTTESDGKVSALESMNAVFKRK